MRKAIVLVCTLAIVLGAVSTLYAADAQALKKKISSAISAGNESAAEQAVRKLGGLNNAAAARALCDLIPRAKNRPAVIEALKKALRYMDAEEAKKTIRSQATKAASYETRVVLTEILGTIGDDESIDVLIKLVRDGKESVAKTAARALGDSGSKKAVKGLIDALKKHNRKKTGAFWDINTALQKITGKMIEDYVDWKNWFDGGKGLDSCDPSHYTAALTSAQDRFSTIFGIKIDSRRVCVVLDTSGSMVVVDPLPEGYSGGPGGFDGSTELDDPEKRKKEREDAERRAKGDREGLGVERQRMKRAQKELLRMIGGFQKGVKFNIIVYNETVTSWKKSLVAASESNKTAALAFVRKLEPESVTFTDDAMKEAFKDKAVDTIILISDGAPTHLGGGGGTQMPPDSERINKEILEWARKENRFRKVTIHTIGFMGANKEFMEQLARENNGKFKDLK
jgi:hypothetical protein